MGSVRRTVTRTAVLVDALRSLLQQLPDQPLKAQLLDLAAEVVATVDTTAAAVEFDEAPTSSARRFQSLP